MKKLIKFILIAIPIIVILLVVAVYFSINHIVKAGVETVAPTITKTDVTLGGVKISILSGAGELQDFVVGNPQGFKTDSAFKAGTIRVKLDVKSLMSDPIIVEEVYVDSPEITYERDITQSNIGRLQKNIEESAGPKKEGEKPGKKVIIRDFTIKNAKLNLAAGLTFGESLTVPLPDIHLTDIGKDSGGASPAQVAQQIFAPLYDAVNQAVAGAGKLLKEGAKTAQEAAEKAGETAKEVGEKAKETGKKAIDTVKGIFE